METEDLAVGNGFIEAIKVSEQLQQQDQVPCLNSGHGNGQKGDASDDDGATSREKRKQSSDRVDEQLEKRLKVEDADATSQSAGEPGTAENGQREQTAGSDEDSCLQVVSDDEQDPSELARVVSDEQAAADLEAIHGMWELAAVYEFMAQFKYWLNFSQLYPVQDLEEAIVRSPGPGLLAQLHVDLLKGIATRSHVGLENWVSTLAARLVSEANAMQQPLKQLPFRPVRGKEAAAYAQLGAVERVLTLKALADMRADREDMRNLVDDIMKLQAGDKPSSSSTPPPPARRSARGCAPAPPTLTPEDMRGRQPLGVDAAGSAYYWFDIPYDHDAPVGIMGSRLYVEGPPQLPQLEEQKADTEQQQQLEESKEQQSCQVVPIPGKPPQPPGRPRGVAAADSVAAASVANSRHGSPDAVERKEQPQQQDLNNDNKAVQEEADDAGDEPATGGANADSCDKRMPAVKSDPQDVAETAVAAADVKEPAAAVEDLSKPTAGESNASGGAGDRATNAAEAEPASAEPAGGQTTIDVEKADTNSVKAEAAGIPMDDAEADAAVKSKKRKSSSNKALAKSANAAGSTPSNRPGRKAAAEASFKMALQLAPGSTARSGTVEAERPHVVSTGKRKRDSSSAVGSTAAEEPTDGDEAVKPAAQSQQQQSEGDAALAAELAASGRSRPTRRAAADASAKIAAQSQNLPIYKLAEEASKAAAASGTKDKSSKQRGERKDTKDVNRGAKELRPASAGANYVLPPDHVAGSWRFVSDSVEGLQALAAGLLDRSAPEDMALGRLLQDHVVATLLERKEREEKFARARSRVAKSLGLDSVAIDAGRSRRERKTIKYDHDEFDFKMKTAIRAQQKGDGDIEEFYPVLRNPAAAPEYDIEVRRGRSSGAAAPVISLDEIEKMRKRRIEMQKLRAAGLLSPEEEEQLRQQEEEQQRQEQEEERAKAAEHERQQAAKKEAPQQQQQQQSSGSREPDSQAPAAAGSSKSGSRKRSAPSGSAAPPRPQQQRKQTALAPKSRPPAAPSAPSAWQLAAAAAAASAADSGAAGSGRPRRRAAAGVHAAIAAAAAAAGGREEDFLGMAAHMQDEYESHIGAEHVGRGYGAEGLGLPVRGHFHSSSSQSLSGLTPQQQQQPQQQQPQGSEAQHIVNHQVAQPPTAQAQQASRPIVSAVPESLVAVPQLVQSTGENDAAAAVACDQQQPCQHTNAAGATALKTAIAAGATQDNQQVVKAAAHAVHPAKIVHTDVSLPSVTADTDLASALAAAAAASVDVSGQQQLQQLPAHTVRPVQHQAAQQHVEQQPLLAGEPVEDALLPSHMLTAEGNAAVPQEQQHWQQQQQQPFPMILQGVPVHHSDQLGH